MTPAGRNLFVNCVVYIHRFDGRCPSYLGLGRKRRITRWCNSLRAGSLFSDNWLLVSNAKVGLSMADRTSLMWEPQRSVAQGRSAPGASAAAET